MAETEVGGPLQCAVQSWLYSEVYITLLAVQCSVQFTPVCTMQCTDHSWLYNSVYRSLLAVQCSVQITPGCTVQCTDHSWLYSAVYRSLLSVQCSVQITPVCTLQSGVHSYQSSAVYSTLLAGLAKCHKYCEPGSCKIVRAWANCLTEHTLFCCKFNLLLQFCINFG